MRQVALAPIVMLVSVGLAPAPSWAALPPALRVTATVAVAPSSPSASDAACPSALDVQSALGRVLPSLPLDDRPDALNAAISDEGARWRVQVAGSSRDFLDEGRRCDERARAAAVFIALVLEPPSVEVPTVAPVPTEPATTPSTKSTPPTLPLSPTPGATPSPWWDRYDSPVEIELGGTLALAPSPTALTGGARLGIVAGTRGGGVMAALAVLAPVDVKLDTTTVTLTRVPLDLAARLTRRSGRIDVGAEVGVELALLVLEGRGVAQGGPQTRLDVGLYAGGVLHVWLSRVGVLVGVQASLEPRTYALDVSPLGTIGSTPGLWLSATVGLVLRAH